MKIKILLGMLFTLAMTTIYGCGGGGGAGPTTVSGVVMAGPVINGHVEIFAIDPATGHRGVQLTTVTTDANGAYTAPLGTFTGPIEVEVTRGTYKDEATSATVTLTTPLRATISNATGNTSVMVTPLTELAVRELPLNVHSAANIDKANADISAAFKVANIITTKPADATAAASATAPQAEKDHGLVLAAISHMGKDSGKPLDQILTDMSTAISGATMPVNTTAGFKAAMFNFISDTNLNKTGVTPDTATTINPTTVKVAVLKISRAGGGTIGGMDFTMTLPGDATMAADATKQAADGTVAVSGVAATGANIISTATFDATTKKLKVLLANPNGFAVGQMVTVACTIPTGSTVTPAQLQAAVSAATPIAATDLAGVPVTGVTLTAAAPVFF